MLYGSDPGRIQGALGRSVLRISENRDSWTDFEARLRGEPEGEGCRFVRDNQRVRALVGRLKNEERSPASFSVLDIRRLRDLLVGGSLAQSEQARKWVPGRNPSEETFKTSVLEPFVESRLTKLASVHVVAPPWEKNGKPPRPCKAHAANGNFSRSVCWKRSKWWASVDAFGKRHNFDLAAEPRDRFLEDRNKQKPCRRSPEETLVVEVKLVKGALTKPDPRFIGQLLLARSIHDHVVGICAVIRQGAGARTVVVDSGATKRVVELIGAQFVLIEIPRK
jgi:hypothetical protein